MDISAVMDGSSSILDLLFFFVSSTRDEAASDRFGWRRSELGAPRRAASLLPIDSMSASPFSDIFVFFFPVRVHHTLGCSGR